MVPEEFVGGEQPLARRDHGQSYLVEVGKVHRCLPQAVTFLNREQFKEKIVAASSIGKAGGALKRSRMEPRRNAAVQTKRCFEVSFSMKSATVEITADAMMK